MLSVAIVLAVIVAVMAVLMGAASLNVDEGQRLSVYAALLAVCLLVMGGASIAMFRIMFPQ